MRYRIILLFLFIVPTIHVTSPVDHFTPYDWSIISKIPDRANITVIVLGRVESPYAVKYFDALGFTVLKGPKLSVINEVARTKYLASLNHIYSLDSYAANLGEGLPPSVAPYGRTEEVNGSGITVAVIDTGVDPTHPSLQGKIVGRYDARGEFSSPRDTVGHGTLVSATIAGKPLVGDVHFTSTGEAPEGGSGYPFYIYIPESTTVNVTLTRSHQDPGYDMDLYIKFPSGAEIYIDQSTSTSHKEVRVGEVSEGVLYLYAVTSSSSSGYGFPRYLSVSFHTDVPLGGGIAQGALIYGIKVFESGQISTDTEHILDGIDHAIYASQSHNIRVVNLSLGTTAQDLALDAAMEKLVNDYGILPVVAAGNSGPNYGTIGSPAESPRSLAVGASTIYGTVAYYSSRGNLTNVEISTIKPDVLAVGGGLYKGARIDGADTNDGDEEYPNDLYPNDLTAAIGTSFAAPVVSGIAALLFSAGLSDPYLVKYFILAGTYETYYIPQKDAPPNSEAPNQPTLDRIGKDCIEGRGMTYLPAIMNLALREYTYGSMPNITMSFGSKLGDPKVYAFLVHTIPGENVTFTLMGTSTLDVDLLVYSMNATEIRSNIGNPVIVDASTSTSSRESVSFIANDTSYLVVVRRVKGDGNVTMIYKKIEDTEPPKIEKISAFMIYKYLSLSVIVNDNFGVSSVLLKDQTGKLYRLKPKSDTERYYSGLITESELHGTIIVKDVGGNVETADVEANGITGLIIVAVFTIVMLGIAILLIKKAGE